MKRIIVVTALVVAFSLVTPAMAVGASDQVQSSTELANESETEPEAPAEGSASIELLAEAPDVGSASIGDERARTILGLQVVQDKLLLAQYSSERIDSGESGDDDVGICLVGVDSPCNDESNDGDAVGGPTLH